MFWIPPSLEVLGLAEFRNACLGMFVPFFGRDGLDDYALGWKNSTAMCLLPR